MDIREFLTDSNAIENGHWVENLPGLGDLRLKVRGLNSYAAQIRQMELMAELPADQRLKNMDPRTSDEIQSKLLADAILLDWDGLFENGEPLHYDRDRAFGILTNPDFKTFRNAVAYAAEEVSRKKPD